uniref:Molybdenum cofactor synthesis 2 n=1 Tax=Ovis aries TaxID=9940 RepID=A0AC11DWV8_SHEEP
MVPRCQVEVLYFAKSAEIAGIRSETISVPQEIKALQLWNEIEARHPGLVWFLFVCLFLYCLRHPTSSKELLAIYSIQWIHTFSAKYEKDMNEVEEKSKDIIKFTSEKLSVDEVSQLVISPLCGAISLFVAWFQ